MAGVAIVSKLFRDVASSRLAVSPDGTFATGVVYSSDEPTDDRVVRHEIEGLDPDTEYFYRLEIEGVLQGRNYGRFRTKPVGASSFKFAFASCAQTNSEHPNFNYIRSLDPLFFVHLGDFHYLDIAENDEAVFEAAHDGVMSSRTQGPFYRNLPVQYMWDDHDYGPNNSGASSPSKAASQAVYRRRVPHPPLELSSGAIYHAFTVGRVRFIMTDLRSHRSDDNATDNSSKTTMGATQKQWFKDECLAAQTAGQFIVWVSTSVWNTGSASADTWGKYSTERTELANFFVSNDLVDRMMIINGDRHSIGIDDGTNTVGGVKVFQAAPLDRTNTTTGMGTHSEGIYSSNQNQFGVIEFTDTGGSTITVDCRGFGYGDGELVHYQFSALLGEP